MAMVDSENKEPPTEEERLETDGRSGHPEGLDEEVQLQKLPGLDERKIAMNEDLDDPVTLVERVYHLWWNWADFHLFIVSPSIETVSPPVVIPPEIIPNSKDHEFVYTIHDFGSKLSTSKAEEMFSAGMSMCKLFYTIEKMIDIFIERLKSGGVSPEVEVQVAFAGHQLAQRKAFESVINLSYNVVTNFDPGTWGEVFLQTVKRVADKGYGYPEEAPRTKYKQPLTAPAAVARKD